MSKTAGISLRIEPDIKDMAEELYGSFGLTLSDAITLFLYKSIRVGGLPFDLKQPRFNDETEEAIREAKGILSGKIDSQGYNSADELIAAALEADYLGCRRSTSLSSANVRKGVRRMLMGLAAAEPILACRWARAGFGLERGNCRAAGGIGAVADSGVAAGKGRCWAPASPAAILSGFEIAGSDGLSCDGGQVDESGAGSKKGSR